MQFLVWRRSLIGSSGLRRSALGLPSPLPWGSPAEVVHCVHANKYRHFLPAGSQLLRSRLFTCAVANGIIHTSAAGGRASPQCVGERLGMKQSREVAVRLERIRVPTASGTCLPPQQPSPADVVRLLEGLSDESRSSPRLCWLATFSNARWSSLQREMERRHGLRTARVSGQFGALGSCSGVLSAGLRSRGPKTPRRFTTWGQGGLPVGGPAGHPELYHRPRAAFLLQCRLRRRGHPEPNLLEATSRWPSKRSSSPQVTTCSTASKTLSQKVRNASAVSLHDSRRARWAKNSRRSGWMVVPPCRTE
jgi:hypothetical protein